jgi:RHS repeat-associated protein
LAGVTVAGHTAGAFQVGESGAATFTVPITALPGTSGLEPQLAFTYSNQGNNSLLGVGWSLSGLSVISRCPATVAQDGSLAPVDFNDNDRFCLDGERLMSIGGVYGANATEYRTEQDTFRRVLSQSQAGTGPASFTVWTKAGLILEYGGTVDSRIEAQGKTSVLFWAVNRIADTKGNYLTITYTEDNAEYRPSRIDYTANDAASLTPYASVRFVYEARPDAAPQYIAGSQIKVTQRLSAVRAYEGEQLYREYRLAYQISEATGRSRLVSITECGNHGDCFAPTTFAWQAWATSDFNFNGSSSGTWPGHGGGQSNNFLGDFNGDGKTDIMGYTGSGGIWHVVLSNGVSFGGGGGLWPGNPRGKESNFLGDFNGDGKTDSMGYSGSNGLWYVELSNGSTGFNAPGSGLWQGHSNGTNNNFLGDFNGDGRTDIMSYTGSSGLWNVALSNGSTGFTAPGTGVWQGHGGGISNNFLGDFNGDGMTDIVGYAGGGSWHVTLSNGSTGFNAPGSGPWQGHGGGQSNNFLGDFNGDGKTDIMGYTGSGGLWHVALSNGATGFNAPGSGSWNGHTGGQNNNILGDFNGDGMTDIAGYKGNGIWTVCLSTGTNFSCRDWTGHSGGTGNNFLGDFNGDGKTDTMRALSTQGQWQVALAGGPSPDLLTVVTHGNGAATTVQYASLADTTVYTKGSGALYPEQDFQGPLYVVASYTTSNGIGGTSSFTHRYAGAKVDLQGRGFRGFGQTSVTDALTGIVTTIVYERDYRCISTKVKRTEQRQSNGTLINEVDNTIEVQDHGFGVYFSFVDSSTAKSYELDGALVSTVTTTTDFDDRGNVLTSHIDYGEGLTETTAHTYQDDLSHWFLGRLTRSTVTRTAVGQPTQTRTSSFTYDPVSGLLTSEIIEPDYPNLRLVKTYQHDAFGNVAVSTTSGPGIVSRTHTTAVDARGRYVTSSANPLGHAETKTYALGSLTRLTGPNLLATQWEYDDFGRQTRELRADGTETLTAYTKCQGSCPENAIYFVRSDSTGKPYTVTYYDLLDRVVRQETQGFDGTPIHVDTQYNARGLRKEVSEPYFAGGTPLWTNHTFDVLGRATQETAPGNRITTTEYDGRTTTATNPLGQQNIRTVDTRGQLIASTDNLSGAVTYAYDAFGNMIQLTDPFGHRTTLTYDVRGNKTSVTDPDTGTTTFVYDALGELISQTDANHNTITLTYDVLGRMTSRSEPEGTSTWVYDTQTKGLGKLSRVSRGDYMEEYFYDALGRAEQTRVTIAGASYSSTTGYDLQGRPDVLIYPTGFSVRTLYNTQGYPQELRRTSDNHPLWQADTLNARGQLEQATLGNGLVTTRDFEPETGRMERIRAGAVQNLAFTYDALGNLQSRRDDIRGLSEAFGYDSLNRLTSSQVTGRPAVTLTYDALGNITSKSDVGTYAYGQNGAGPHAVTSITGPKGAAYFYDANGNLIRRQKLISLGLPFADGFESGSTSAWNQSGSQTPVTTTIAYASFNKPTSISAGTTTLTFDYGPEYDRYRQVVTTSAGVTTKLYIGGLFERETTGATVRNIHYIQAGGEVFAVYITEGAQQSTRYLHRDHLGSVQTITSETGTVVEVLAFDPWGLRRNAQDWSPATAPIISTLDRGFTGHEHLDEVDLIHMNGRVYDPVIGRFLSADPFVQVPEFSQSLNRYSYVLNNPLSMTDPNGLFFRGLGRFFGRIFNSAIGRVAVSIVAGYLTMGIGATIGQAILGSWLGAATAGAIGSGAGFGLGSSFTGALLSGGGLGDALRAGFLGALTNGLSAGTGSLFSGAKFGLNVAYAEDVVAHGVTQGLSRVAKGDKFEHGFLSGIFSRVFSPGSDGLFSQDPVLHTLSSAVIGGTVSELGGGKFANGAATTAFITGFTHIALEMRAEMIAQSKIETDGRNSNGKSAGFWGDCFKLGGGRFDALHRLAESLLGGRQSGPGKIFNIGYDPGSTLDRLVEAYAGPHDFLNSWYWYDARGNIDVSVYSSVVSEKFGSFLNAVDVVIATPLAITSMVPKFAVNDFAFQSKPH